MKNHYIIDGVIMHFGNPETTQDWTGFGVMLKELAISQGYQLADNSFNLQKSHFWVEALGRDRDKDKSRGRGISSDPEIMWGAPVISGTRIPVHSITDKLEDGIKPIEIITKYYPELTYYDIIDASNYNSGHIKNISFLHLSSHDKVSIQ